MQIRQPQGFGQAGLAVALTLDQILPPVPARPGWRANWRDRLSEAELVTDLGEDLFSRRWWQGLATCSLLIAGAIALAPGFRPIADAVPAPVSGIAWEETRAQSIAPLAWGADTGKRLAPTDAVVPLDNVPERPQIGLTASLGQGDSFQRVLERAGVAGAEARRAAALVDGAAGLSTLVPGARIDIVLGRRPNRNVARPLESVTFRARLDLKLAILRSASGLVIQRTPIAVDRTPMRIEGRTGASLYRSARAAGIPAKLVETYIRLMAEKGLLSDATTPDARFELVFEHARAATGETESGKLLLGGLQTGNKSTHFLRWTIDGREGWFDAKGVSERRGGMARPVSGRLTSGFGMRLHPLLGYSRFHRGVDFGAAWGSPIHAVTDGVVRAAGWAGGYGKQVRLSHAGNMATSYSHMSRIAVSPGMVVRTGQVIGYVGSTGLSTGPHLHLEVYRNGQVVNPRSVSFTSAALLSGKELTSFKSRLLALRGLPLGNVASSQQLAQVGGLRPATSSGNGGGN